MSRNYFCYLLIVCSSCTLKAQHTYVGYEQSVFGLQLISHPANERTNRFEGAFKGGSLQLRLDKRNSFRVGMGLSSISYEKEWQGVFPESNEFGIAKVNGTINYWSFPISYYWTGIVARKSNFRCGGYRRERLHLGFNLGYTPSFQGGNNYTVSTAGGADLAIFSSNYHSTEQSFQHSLTIGLSDQIFLLEHHLMLDINPFVGLGSGYFKETGTSISTFSYGLNLRLTIRAKLPRITIEKEISRGNAEEKKNALKEKQKEIEEKLKQTKPKQ